MMVVVAIVASILGGQRAWNHYRDCHQSAIDYRYREILETKECRRLEETLSVLDKEATDTPAKKGTTYDLVRWRGRAEYYSRLGKKYERAAMRPWETISADPPAAELAWKAAFHARKGEFGLAIAEYDAAIREFEAHHGAHQTLENAESYKTLALILATCSDARHRDGRRAVTLAKRACEMTNWKNVAYIDTLAASHAEAGDFKSAIKRQSQAIEAAGAANQGMQGMKMRFVLYSAGKPYHRIVRWPGGH